MKFSKKACLIVTGALIFTGSFCLALFLLYDSKLSGTEFVAFVIAFAVIGLVIAFIDEVQEFSLGGNRIKFRELKKEAEKTIAELKTARTETFRFLLSMAKRLPGGYGKVDTHDSRVKDFWFLYNKIVEFECDKELKVEILESVKAILGGQLNSIKYYSDNLYKVYSDRTDLPTPDDIENNAFNPDSIEKSAKAHNKTVEETKSCLKESVNEYKKLHELKERLEKYEKN